MAVSSIKKPARKIIYVANAGSNDVFAYENRNGKIRQLEGKLEGLSFPISIATDPEGYVYIANREAHNLMRFSYKQ